MHPHLARGARDAPVVALQALHDPPALRLRALPRAEAVERGLRGFLETAGWSAKELFMPVRVALTGRTATPPLFETMEVLGKERCRRRLRRAIDTLKTIKGS